mgnify:CR=1 FL=1
MIGINFLGSNLIRAYINFQANPDNLEDENIKKMQEEMGMEDDGESTPKQKVEKYIVEQSTEMSQEVKRLIEEMKKQQAKLLALGQAAEANKFQAELDQKNELAASQAQSEADFINRLSKDELTTVLKQVISDDSENADDANTELVATLTNMIAEKNSTTTVNTEA